MHCISNFNAINLKKKKNYKEEILGVSDKALPQGFQKKQVPCSYLLHVKFVLPQGRRMALLKIGKAGQNLVGQKRSLGTLISWN